MPRIATGYWNAKNTPSRARSSGVMAKRSFPSYNADPAVTVYAGCPARTWASAARDRVLHRKDPPPAGGLPGGQGEESLPLAHPRPRRDGVRGMPGQDLGERALARAVRAHDGMDLAGVHRQIHAIMGPNGS